MPVTKSAKKALRRDKRRIIINARIKKKIKEALRAAKKNPTEKTIVLASSAVDKAAKKNYIHKNKAARFKSKLAKLLKSSKK